jgi:hypothetical protein
MAWSLTISGSDLTSAKDHTGAAVEAAMETHLRNDLRDVLNKYGFMTSALTWTGAGTLVLTDIKNKGFGVG